MSFVKKISAGLLVLGLTIAISFIGQKLNNVHAANSLTNSNTQVITVGGTTDSLPVNAAISPQAYSGDGNVVLFISSATNLPNSNGVQGLYVYNIRDNLTSRIDISTNGVVANGGLGYSLALSESGRYVTFVSLATNLIDGSTEPSRQLYKRDTQNSTTTYIGGWYGGEFYQWDRNLGLSNDGRFTLLSSTRTGGNTYPYNPRIIVGDSTSGTYTWATLANGSSAYYDALTGGISCDGSFAVYKQQYSIILADLRRGTTTTITAASGDSTSPMISCNGRYVLYATNNRTDITPTPSGMNSYLHLARYDRITGQRMYIDSNSTGVISTAQIQYNPSYTNLQDNDFNASIADTGDVVLTYNGSSYLKHLSDGSGTLESVAQTTSGVAYNGIYTSKLTTDGRYIFFTTDPYNLGLAASPSSSKIIRVKTNI